MLTRRIIKRQPAHAEDLPTDGWVQRVGGGQIFAWKVSRFASCLALLGLSVADLVLKPHKGSTNNHPDTDLLIGASLVGVYVYTSVLALWALLVPVRKVKPTLIHLASVLLAVWATFTYRNIWPLATYNLTPLDIPTAPSTAFFWVQYSILTFAAVVAPLLVPTPYIAVDPLHPYENPAPEQTTSLLGFLLFSFLDPLVWEGYRSKHLAFDRLPALADYDAALHLKARAFKHLDPFKHTRHAFWGFVATFKGDYVALTILISLRVITSFLAPVGLNRLLNYIETGGVDAVIQPWLWISWLFLGPLASSVAMQWYIFIATRLLVRIESIVTELVFEHALRIRMKEETNTPSAQGTPTPSETTTVIDPEEDDEGDASSSPEGSETLQGSEQSESSAGAQKKKKHARSASVATTGSTKSEKKEEKSENLIGKINNLVTSDLNNIGEARDFLFLGA